MTILILSGIVVCLFGCSGFFSELVTDTALLAFQLSKGNERAQIEGTSYTMRGLQVRH